MQLPELNGFNADLVMDGFEPADTLSGSLKTKDAPIIFLSANNIDKKFIARGCANRATDHIIKPFDPDILLLKTKIFIRLAITNKPANKLTSPVFFIAKGETTIMFYYINRL